MLLKFVIQNSAKRKITGYLSTASVRKMASFYGFSADTIDGEKVDMAKYKGKVVLIENTASL